MAVINVSIPAELVKKIDRYKTLVKKNRSEFFADAVQLYFNRIDIQIAFEKRKKAIKNLMKIGDKLRKEGILEDIDVVEELRKMRQERTDELLGRVR
jgi:metal-responsive CopG/Arc/MetJ family transcriptional regulator